MSTLLSWREHFKSLDRKCPWPGPRPMTDADSLKSLVRRSENIDHIADDVLTHQIVVLTGESGVGKSSLLNVGLVDQLREHGFTLMVCNEWGSTSTWSNAESFIASKIQQLPDGIDITTPGAASDFCRQLESAYSHAVLILDQFEELIRYQPQQFHAVVDWIVEVNRKYSVRILLSLRTEYLHRLKPLEKMVRPFTMATFTLKPISDDEEAIREIIRSGNEPGSISITDGATNDLIDAWRSAITKHGRWSGLGLLQLQAVLYTLHARADGRVIDIDTVSEMTAAAHLGHSEDIFMLGMIEAVSLKLGRCEQACADAALDPYLVTGVTSVVRRISAQLSSGGYKLVQEQWSLAETVLHRELNILSEPDDQDAKRIFKTLSSATKSRVTENRRDLLSDSRENIGQIAGVVYENHQTKHLASLGVDALPWVNDPDDSTSGPMLGFTPKAVIIEELRRFVFAIEWLLESSLIRASTPGDLTMLSLIHDGFGSALDRWSGPRFIGPKEALALMTAARGEAFIWQTDRSDVPAFLDFDGTVSGGEEKGYVTVANVRWRDCRISASFRRVVFVNCDFRGTRFESCGFRGVVFINCLLDGATFGDCTIYGRVTSPSPNYSEDLPSFSVPVDSSLSSALIHYRMTTDQSSALNRYHPSLDESPELYSVTSGVAAIPWVEEGVGVSSDVLGWEPQSGGLVMYGGRLSSLMIRNCAFKAGGVLALRHIAGSSLDIVEQNSGEFEIFGAVIRGLSISRPVDQQRGQKPISLRVVSSIVANTFFGDGLAGTATFENSQLWQLMNTSDRQRFIVQVGDCLYTGLVNVADINRGSAELSNFQLHELGERSSVVDATTRMNYRRQPARLELESRSARARRK